MKTYCQTVVFSARLGILALALAATFSVSALASEELDFRRTAGAFSVYLAVMPAEIITGPQPGLEPGATPYQPPAAKDTHHVMVSIFDYRTGRRITDAAVAARVAALGFSGEKRTLKPIAFAGSVVYTSLFPMIGRGPFRVDVEFRTSSTAQLEHVTFYFTHPQFTVPQPDNRQ